MKYLPFVLFTATLTAQADEGIRLNCPSREALTVSFFNYSLITMKWKDHFEIASGKKKSHTSADIPFWSTTFSNGDHLAFFPDSGTYYLFYTGVEEPEKCSETGRFVYPVITPPRYEKRKDAQQTQVNTPKNDVILLRPAA